MNKKLLLIVLILVTATTNCTFAAKNAATKIDDPKKDLMEALKDRLAKRQAVVKEYDDSDQSSESWDEEPKVEQHVATVEPVAKVKESERIGSDQIAQRKAVLAKLLASRVLPTMQDPESHKKTEKSAEEGATAEDVVPLPLTPRSVRNTKSEAEATTSVITAPQQIKPVKVPVLAQGKEYYKKQLNRVYTSANQCVKPGCTIVDEVEHAKNNLENMPENDLKNLLNRFNNARLMSEILSFNKEIQSNNFLIKHGLSFEEKLQIQVRALMMLHGDYNADVLSVVESLLPKRFFVENYKILVKMHLLPMQAINPDFAFWYDIIADDEFYNQNNYQINRAFGLIDKSSDLLESIKNCTYSECFSRCKDELSRIVSELRWLWILIDIKKYQGMAQQQRVSLRYYYSSEIFIDLIKSNIKQIQDLIDV